MIDPHTIVVRPCDDYIKEETVKKYLVLHYTAGGSAEGALAHLDMRDYVNVHYLLARDGTLYNSIPEKYWAYHTGLGASFDRYAIGLEIEAWGHLKRKGTRLYAWANDWGVKVPWGEVVRCAPFRGFKYWHDLSEAQKELLPDVVRYITSHWLKMLVTTHAQIKKTKLDFPPDYPLVSDLVTL